MLELNEVGGDRLGERPFRFLVAWMLHEEYFKWMEREWSSEGDLTCLLECLIEKLRAWNIDTFGNINKRKSSLQRRLDGVSKAMGGWELTVGLLKLERRLKREWTEVLMHEEIMWMQKSHVDWLRFGDQNTRFFHTSTLVRRRRNKIEMLRRENGDWDTEKTIMKDVAV